MPWHELELNSTIDFAEGLPAAIDDPAGLLVFTTAKLRWQPLASDDPDGARIAMLWGDRSDRTFAAVLHFADDAPGLYTLVRRLPRERFRCED